MAQMMGLVSFTTNTVISSSDANGNNTIITATYNAHDIAITAVHGATAGTGVLAYANQLVPVGSIIAHYDFDAAVTINTSYWAYCDGSVISNASSALNGQTLPDLSNRYLVGFGTEGGGDIDSAAWATDAVGNASHQVNLSHYHKYGYSSAGVISLYQVADSTSRYITSSSFNNTASGSGGRTSWDSISLNNADLNTWTGGSTTQSIQPRSVRVRWIMRLV